MHALETVGLVDPKHYVWWFPGSPVKVHLSLSVVQRLGQGLWVTGNGASKEGLLFGRTQDGATEILEFEPIAEGITVPAMVAGLPSERRHSLVGYYRTEEGATFRLNSQDLSLAKECFANPHNVLLMIHSSGFGPPTATFFFHDGAGHMADFAFLEFPFDSSLLAIEERDRLQRSHQSAIAPLVAVSAPVPPAPAAYTRRPRRGFLPRAALWAGSVAMVFALGMSFNNGSLHRWYSRLSRGISSPNAAGVASVSAARSSSRPSLALHMVRQNGDLELTWSRESALIAAATSGVISIQDGQSRRLVSLDWAQLRGGTLLYSPASDQVLMQLTVTTPTDTVTESVTAILPHIGEPQAFLLPTPGTPSISVTSSAAQAVRATPVKAPKPFTVPTSAKGASSPPPDVEEAPALRIEPGAPTAIPSGVAQALSPPPPPAVRPPQQQAPSSAPNVATFDPPVPVVKRSPVVPPELRNVMGKQTVVQVRVTIDKDGKVAKADAIPQGNVSKLLLNAAVDAARSWRFQPARRNHEPVSTDWVLQFVFSR
jgi:periplasmic protein TonB